MDTIVVLPNKPYVIFNTPLEAFDGLGSDKPGWWNNLTYDDAAAILLTAGCPRELVPGLKTPAQTTKATTVVGVQQAQTLALTPRNWRDCLIPKAGPEDPQLTVRFDSAIETQLQPILVQCISQAKVLLQKCQNFETLKKWA